MRIRQNSPYTILDSKGAAKEYTLVEQGKKVLTFVSSANPNELLSGHTFDKEKWTFQGYDGKNYSIQKKEKAGRVSSKLGADALTGGQITALEGLITLASEKEKSISFKHSWNAQEWIVSIKKYLPNYSKPKNTTGKGHTKMMNEVLASAGKPKAKTASAKR